MNSISGWTRKTWITWGGVIAILLAYDWWRNTMGTFSGVL
jgi:hypothetical protein